MPRYAIDLSAMADRYRTPSPAATGLNAALAAVLNGWMQRGEHQRQDKQRADDRAFKMSEFLQTEADKHEEIAARRQDHQDAIAHQGQEDSFRSTELAETHGHNVAEAAERERHDKVIEDHAARKDQDAQDLDDATAADAKQQSELPAWARHGGDAGGGKASNPYAKINPYKEDPDTHEKILKTPQEISDEKKTIDDINGGAGTSDGMSTQPGFEAFPTHSITAGSGPGVAATPPTPAPPTFKPPAPLPLPTMGNDEEQGGSGIDFTPAPDEKTGSSKIMQEIPDFADQYNKAKVYANGDELQKFRQATAAGDHEGVQYFLGLWNSRDPEGDGAKPDLPQHWQQARAAAGEPNEDAPPTDTGPMDAPAVR